MAPPPWEQAPSHDQFFALITGANSGVGLAICERLIDEFLATRPRSAHLILIPTTRSVKKSCETIMSVRSYLAKTVQSEALRGRAGPDGTPHALAGRVHVISVELDLCKLPTIYAAASKLCNGQLRDPTGVIANGDTFSIPRLDAAIFNAGYGGWSGLDWISFAKQIWNVGLVQACTFPLFKMAIPTAALPPQDLSGTKAERPQPRMAEVFTANTFGHYILAHELLPLLRRTKDARSRVIWTSTIDAEEPQLDWDDLQTFNGKAPYENSKRVTDLITLTSELPSVDKVSQSFFGASPSSTRPRFYLSQPGVVCTPLFPLNAFLFFWYTLAMYLCRFLGSPWHTITPYLGATSAVWLALASQEELDAENAHESKWGSACDWRGVATAKRNELDGWGWDGRIEDDQAIRNDTSQGVLRRLVGRRWDAVALTQESRTKFEEDARECWRQLEELRTQWDGLLGSKANGA